jgi:hypothetical protein
MPSHLILWPVVGHVVLTLAMFIVLAARKAKAIRAGTADRKATALSNQAWPADVVQVSNNIANQFEVPVLFHVLCLALLATNGVSTASLVVAGIFLLSRVAHAWVHITSNYVPMRLRFFSVSVLMTLGLVGLLIAHLVTLSSAPAV